MSLDVDRDDLRLPKGYHVYELEDQTMLGDSESDYNIKNRPFRDIDGYFSNAISKTINDLSSNQPDRQIRILDLAGGINSQAVKDLSKFYGEKVKAVNMDIAQSARGGMGAVRVQGDAVFIPLADSSVDVVYCRQFLPFIKRFRREHSQYVRMVLKEVARVIKPGGVAFLDDEEELSGPRSVNQRQELAKRLGVSLEPSDSGNMVHARRNYPRFWQREERFAKYLVMKKLSS